MATTCLSISFPLYSLFCRFSPYQILSSHTRSLHPFVSTKHLPTRPLLHHRQNLFKPTSALPLQSTMPSSKSSKSAKTAESKTKDSSAASSRPPSRTPRQPGSGNDSASRAPSQTKTLSSSRSDVPAKGKVYDRSGPAGLAANQSQLKSTARPQTKPVDMAGPRRTESTDDELCFSSGSDHSSGGSPREALITKSLQSIEDGVTMLYHGRRIWPSIFGPPNFMPPSVDNCFPDSGEHRFLSVAPHSLHGQSFELYSGPAFKKPDWCWTGDERIDFLRYLWSHCGFEQGLADSNPDIRMSFKLFKESSLAEDHWQLRLRDKQWWHWAKYQVPAGMAIKPKSALPRTASQGPHEHGELDVNLLVSKLSDVQLNLQREVARANWLMNLPSEDGMGTSRSRTRTSTGTSSTDSSTKYYHPVQDGDYGYICDGEDEDFSDRASLPSTDSEEFVVLNTTSMPLCRCHARSTSMSTEASGMSLNPPRALRAPWPSEVSRTSASSGDGSGTASSPSSSSSIAPFELPIRLAAAAQDGPSIASGKKAAPEPSKHNAQVQSKAAKVPVREEEKSKKPGKRVHVKGK
ncbi:hypothetical protein BDY17DRAFT_49973 [Neohortaea acidophila]|uniref:Uncharacterized protein n=1 Tax=Neohortaea acidophila TaxID=245834 RepID=A0A6A6PHQ7_9PEZI|nr:uncharacterized protein BDY17DRAFT_49973 [Neohortaea acidophila]KAF2479123.1 hypothetical protein BDY17DRAFT_49973 [Neohortaea acidophila]